MLVLFVHSCLTVTSREKTFFLSLSLSPSLVALVALCSLGLVQSAAGEARSAEHRDSLYRDDNGYFAAQPLEEWKKETFPEETIRSKVAFHHTKDKDLLISVISGPTPAHEYTFDDLYRENKQKLGYLRQRFPSGEFNITTGEIEGRQSVIQRNSEATLGEQEIILFINKDIWYSIS